MKRNRIKWFVLGGLVLLVIGSNALADYNVLDKTTYKQNATSGQRVNDTGDLRVDDMDRDRDYPGLENVFTGVVLNINSTYQTPNAIDVSKFTRLNLHLSWGTAAAADSDSVFIMVRVYGKSSTGSGNYHLWTPLGSSISTGDTCQSPGVVADSAGAAKCLTPAPSFVVVRGITNYALLTKVVMSQLGGGSSTTRGTLRKIPTYAWRYAGFNGVDLELVNNAGAPAHFDYLFVEITNLSFTRNLTSVHMDLHGRTN